MKEILFWTSHKQYRRIWQRLSVCFLQTRTSRLPTNARTRGLDTICVLNRAVGGYWPKCGGVVSENIFSVQSDDFLILKRQQKRYAKLCVYDCLQLFRPAELPWGALTGIRPTKLACELTAENGDYKEAFRSLFHVTEPKIELD